MSEFETSHPKQDKVHEGDQSAGQKKPGQSPPAQTEKVRNAEYEQEKAAVYNVQPQYMNTMPEANNEYYMQTQDENKKSQTQNNFNPRNTFQTQSSERGSGMQRFARLSGNWDQRFHVSPSVGNKKSHTYYKQFFDKPTRSTQGVVLKPRKRLDPYLENEAKSRIPEYSRQYRECKS